MSALNVFLSGILIKSQVLPPNVYSTMCLFVLVKKLAKLNDRFRILSDMIDEVIERRSTKVFLLFHSQHLQVLLILFYMSLMSFCFS